MALNGKAPSTAAEWLADLDSSDSRAKRAQLKLGGLTADDAHLLDGLLAGLDAPDRRTKFWAVQGIARLAFAGVRGQGLVARLVRLLQEEPAFGTRQAVLTAISYLGEDAAPAVPAVVQALMHDPEPLVRSRAADALGTLGAAAAPAVPALLDALEGTDVDVYDRASISLKCLGPIAMLHGPRIRHLAANHPSEDVRDQLGVLLRPQQDI